MQYFYYPKSDEVLQVESAVPPMYNGEEGVEISYAEYNAHVVRINAAQIALYDSLVAERIAEAEEVRRQKDAIFERLGLTPEERAVLQK